MERAHLLRAKRCMLLFHRLASFFIMQFCSYSYSIILIFFIFSFFLSFRFAGCTHLDVDGWRAVERRDRRRLHAQGSVPDEPIGYWCSGIHRYRCLHLQVEIDSFLMKRKHISSIFLFYFVCDSLPLSYLLHRKYDHGFMSYLDASLMGRNGVNCTTLYSSCARLN